MTTGHVFIATSLDGNIARADDRLDWLDRFNTGDEDYGYDAHMASVDGLVMGRGTYETVRSFGKWPYEKPVVVLSRTLSDADIPKELREQVRLSTAAPGALMRELDAQGWRRAYIDGGVVIQSFLREGLIADLTITTIPVLIGEGRRLFGEIERDIDLTLEGSRSFQSGVVISTYRVDA